VNAAVSTQPLEPDPFQAGMRPESGIWKQDSLKKERIMLAVLYIYLNLISSSQMRDLCRVRLSDILIGNY
jgi:hypothetical protein